MTTKATFVMLSVSEASVTPTLWARILRCAQDDTTLLTRFNELLGLQCKLC